MIDVRKAIRRKLKDFNKKGFLIDIDNYSSKPTKDGFISPPSDETMREAIEKYCKENNYNIRYLSISDPIIFSLNDNETYETYPQLRGGRYVVHCVEVKK